MSGIPPAAHDVGRCTVAQKYLSVSPLLATLAHSLSRKFFPCHSYANTRDMGVTAAPNFCSSLLSDFSRHSPLSIRPLFSYSCKSTFLHRFPFTSLQISRRCGGTPSVSRHSSLAAGLFLSCYYRAGTLFTQSAFCEGPPSTIEAPTHASRNQASQQPRSQAARYLSDWKRYRRPHLLRGDQDGGAQSS